MRAVTAASALVLALPLAACGAGEGTAGSNGRELTVLAAASLSDVYEDLAAQLESDADVEVTFSFGSSTDLAAQVADGAPGDVLATADETSMQPAVDAGAVRDPTVFAANELVIVTPPDNPAGIRSVTDLAGTTWVRCAPEVPCGRVADAVLQDNDVQAEPASLEDDVRATLDKVVSGEADAGLVYASDAVAAAEDVGTVAIAGAEERLTTYVVAPLEQSQHPDLARAWVDLLTAAPGRRALTDAGFTLP